MRLTNQAKTDQFNQEDVATIIKKLSGYSDLYTKKLVGILEAYSEHRDFKKLHEDIFSLDALNLSQIPFHDLWYLDARMCYLEVIYPE